MDLKQLWERKGKKNRDNSACLLALPEEKRGESINLGIRGGGGGSFFYGQDSSKKEKGKRISLLPFLLRVESGKRGGGFLSLLTLLSLPPNKEPGPGEEKKGEEKRGKRRSLDAVFSCPTERGGKKQTDLAPSTTPEASKGKKRTLRGGGKGRREKGRRHFYPCPFFSGSGKKRLIYEVNSTCPISDGRDWGKGIEGRKGLFSICLPRGTRLEESRMSFLLTLSFGKKNGGGKRGGGKGKIKYV